MRRCCSRRDAQRNARTLADDIRISSLDAVWPRDLKKHVQLNHARLTSSVVMKDKNQKYCKCRCHTHARNTKPQGPSFEGCDVPIHSAQARARQRHCKGKYGKGKGKEKHGDSKTRTRTRFKVGIVECAVTAQKDCWSKKIQTNKGCLQKGKDQEQERNGRLQSRLDETTKRHLLIRHELWECGLC